MSVKVEEKISGISGPDKICTLHPFEVLEVIERDTPEEPEDDLGKPPMDGDPNKLLDWLIKVLQFLKRLKNR